METFTVEEIVEDDRKSGIVSLAILNMISEQYKEILPEGKKSIDIEIKFNGVEVSFRDFMTRLEKAYSDNLKEAAFELFKEKLDSLTDTIYKIERFDDCIDVIANYVKF